MNYRDHKALKDLADALAEALAEIPLPPGELSVSMNIEKDWSGDREVEVVFKDKPRQLCKVRRRDPNPIDGHKLASLSFMRNKRAA